MIQYFKNPFTNYLFRRDSDKHTWEYYHPYEDSNNHWMKSAVPREFERRLHDSDEFILVSITEEEAFLEMI